MPVTALSFEIHLEPDRQAPRLFLMQDGARVSAASSLVPKSLRELIQSQKTSVSFEKELAEFLDREGEGLSLYVHTSRGLLRMTWDSSALGTARTELDLAGGLVRIRKVAGDKNHPEGTVRELARVGERLVGDLQHNRLFRLSNAAGWYAADQLRESSYGAEAGPADPDALTYEPDLEAEFSPAPLPGARQAAPARTFEEISKPFEVTPAHFNDKKIGYPAEQRSGYLKDLVLQADGGHREASEAELSFRVTLERKSGSSSMRLKGACFWDGRWFDLGAGFFRYFEHLNAMRSGALRRKPVKKALAEAALRLLSENSETRAEKAIELELAKLSSLDEPSLWEAREYLRRFFRAFVLHEVENLLARADGWFLVPADPRKFGALFSEVQALFGGELLDWLARQEKDVPAWELFSKLRPLHARLEAHGIQLCYRERPVKKAGLRVKVRATRSAGMDWFKIHPQIRWGGRVLSREEWRSILENQGALEEADGLVMLEESSLRTLEALRALMAPSPGNRKEEAEEFFRSDRLHILDWVQLRRLGVEVELPPEDERLIRRLLRFEKMESRPAPERLRGQLRDYQKDGYDWLAFLYEHGLGGCLADDMGLGKTVQAIAFLGGLREGKIRREGAKVSAPHLVVVPSTLVFNWKREFENFYPDLTVREYGGSPRRGDLGGAEVVLTTYDIVRREQAFFQKQRFHAVIFDEAQYMKNLSAKRTASARRLRCDFALTLTGTPLENHLGEYYSILDLSLPGLLGDYEDFRRWSLDDPLERLKKRAAPFVLRRTKDKTLKELPSKTETEVFLRMSQKQKALYRSVVSRARRDVKDAFSEKPAPQAAFSALTALLRLRQICVSPKLLDERVRERSPKIEYMLSKLRELVEEDHSALVFSQFTSFLDVLEEEIKAEKLDYLRMDGTTPKTKRKALVDSFQCGAGAPIFLISLKTGGVGLNLTRASYVFHLDPWWNPAVENQASDRVHRIGQKKNVYVTRLLMQHSVEEKMMVLKKRKADLYRQVLEGLPSKGGKQGLLTREDFEFLLGNGGTSARNNENYML